MRLQTPKGTSDYIGERAKKLNRIIRAFQDSFELFGFNPIKTPTFEYASILKGKYGADEKLIYEFKDKGNRELALRYDLTVPLARVVGSNQFSLPAKLYSIGSVFRYDRPQKGRTREFMQADIDIIGSTSISCDVELIACMNNGFNSLGLKPTFRINNRNLMNQIFEQINISESKYAEVLRAIDKLDKIGVTSLEKELKSIGIPTSKLIKIILIKGNSKSVSSKLNKLDITIDFSELDSLFEQIYKIQLNPAKLKIDLSLARGLDYYTGNVYEIDIGEELSVGGGGRYSRLINDLTGKDLNGIGISVGITRLLDLVSLTNSDKNELFIISIDSDISKIITEIRKEGITCSYDLNSRSLNSSLKYADKQDFDNVIIIGKREVSNQKYVLRNMKNGKEENLTIKQIISKFK
jgi:histidyl-tRNA synthetase